MLAWWLLPLLAGLSHVALTLAQGVDCTHARNMESCGAFNQFQCAQMQCCYDSSTGACFRDKQTTSSGECHFPFIYLGVSYQGCLPINDNQRWCSLTPNWDTDSRHGFCPPQGNWGAWSAFSACSWHCGVGTRTRTRVCEPSSAQCTGSRTEEEQCNTHACTGSWTLWTDAGACSVTCGPGSIQRTRTCQPAGAQCPQGINFAVQPCNIQSCTAFGSWGQWAGFGACTEPCGTGNKQRTRACLPAGSTCATGSNTDIQLCNTHQCPGAWSPWTDVGTCTKTCGTGTIQRTRVCQPPGTQCPAGTFSTETRQCNTGGCPGTWGQWGVWGTCTLTCGGGEKTRSRTCFPANAVCTTGQEHMVAVCNQHVCAAGTWGAWGAYGECSVECGGGTRSRERQCSTQAACTTGSSTDTAACNTHVCKGCQVIACANGGTCEGKANGGICACATGYAGPLCEKDIRCKNGASTCEHEGVCTYTTESGVVCVCTEKWTGKTCAHANLCFMEAPCVYGDCFMDGADYVCDCDSGWEGLHCDSDKLPLVIGIAAGTYVVVMMLLLLLVLSIIRCR